MQTKDNNVPERDTNHDIRYRDVDFDATLFVCGYTVDEAQARDNVVVRCRICGAPMMRSMADLKRHPYTLRNPCEDCRKAFTGFRLIMWGDQERVRKNAAMREWYAAHTEERSLYQRRQYHALKNTDRDLNVYKKRYYYAMRGRGSV